MRLMFFYWLLRGWINEFRKWWFGDILYFLLDMLISVVFNCVVEILY